MLLQIKNLHSGYGKFNVLQGFDCEVNNGEIVVLIGPNGAGKSTVLKSIFGITEIHKGDIIFKDENLRKVAKHDLIRLGINYVPQGRIVFPNITTKENLLMGGLILDNDLLKERLERILEEFSTLKNKLNILAGSLSGGEQQILALARGLISDPELLLLDEPSLG
ncbi:MAG: ATP-binding cassette domain-containing protein, partial [Patescibacteria group bacterium]